MQGKITTNSEIKKNLSTEMGTPSFPGGSMVKKLLVNPGAMGLILGSERSPGGGHGNPIQYSCLENPIDRGA